MEEFGTFLALSLFPVLGLLLLIIGIIFRRRRKEIAQSCIPTQGVLVGHVKPAIPDLALSW